MIMTTSVVCRVLLFPFEGASTSLLAHRPSQRLVRGRDWYLCAGCNPIFVGLELQSELLVENSQIAITTAHHCFGHDRLHLLRDDPDVDFVIAVINEAIEANAVVEMADKHNV